ncbi:MAG: hypothetical protein D6776_09130 [Planctomycetota bacterium]|nr:MAG: hypothetical protein D6776_09130 [Planctomycetota bacterium]
MTRAAARGRAVGAGLAVVCALLAPATVGRAAPAPDPQAAFRRALAHRFAPQLRYNAYSPQVDAPNNNRNEDFFPGSVDAFLRALVTGRYRVVQRMSVGPEPALVGVLEAGSGRLERTHLAGYPERMAGAPPGRAPSYVHVYRAGQTGDDTRWWCEYWQWYPYDHACARVLGRGGCVGGHRGDWEHQSFELRVPRGGGPEAARLVRGVFYGHGWAISLEAARLERVDDEGRGTPTGTHPVVYVSVGKHASYPYAGELRAYVASRWLVDHDDVFHGNGVWIDTWRAPLVDIAPPARRAHPERFASEAWRTLVGGRDDLPPDWLSFRGRWGPDGVAGFGLNPVRSPTGPYAKRCFGDAGASAQPFDRWRQRFGDRLRLDREIRRAPLPARRPAPLPREAASAADDGARGARR